MNSTGTGNKAGTFIFIIVLVVAIVLGTLSCGDSGSSSSSSSRYSSSTSHSCYVCGKPASSKVGSYWYCSTHAAMVRAASGG